MTHTVAALFVSSRGPYAKRPDVDAWPESRNAMLYAGPLPVIAHPPCARWCQLAGLVEHRYGYRRGEDGGTFESALNSLRMFGGVLEHPAHSAAWTRFDLLQPPSGGGWRRSMLAPNEWVCEVAQVAYGHRARKLTWLVYVGQQPPAELDWSRPPHRGVVSGARNNCGRPNGERLWQAEASRTPPAFVEALIALALQSRKELQ